MFMRYVSLALTAGLIVMPEAGHGQSAGLSLGASPVGAAAVTAFAGMPLGGVPWRDAAADNREPSTTGSIGATPLEVVRKCRRAVVAAALPHRVARVDAAGAGPMTPVHDGYVAPIHFSIVYGGARSPEPRQATIACLLDQRRRVIAVR